MLINLSVAIISQGIGVSKHLGNSLATQWLGLHALTAKSLGSIPGWETKVPQAAQCMRKKIQLYALNIYNFYQLYLNKAGGKDNFLVLIAFLPSSLNLPIFPWLSPPMKISPSLKSSYAEKHNYSLVHNYVLPLFAPCLVYVTSHQLICKLIKCRDQASMLSRSY